MSRYASRTLVGQAVSDFGQVPSAGGIGVVDKSCFLCISIVGVGQGHAYCIFHFDPT